MSQKIVDIPPFLMAQMKKKIVEAIDTREQPLYATFDADGTLWSGDAGESFFKYQIAECGLKGLPADPWGHYLEMKDVDAPQSCLWLAQINKGRNIDEVREWAKNCFKSSKHLQIHKSQLELIDFLRKNAVEVFVVTASIKWAVEPGAELLGFDSDHVLGIETLARNGILSDEGIYPLSHGAGKADVFLKATHGIRPILASGNTMSDIPLIELATHVNLAVASDEPGGLVFESENKLLEFAKVRSWFSHRFRV